MKRPIQILNVIICLAALVLLTGCICPHSEGRSPEVWGRVLDARTHAPIQGAKVFLAEPPQHATYTDEKGRFHMKATRNFVWARIAPDANWPNEKSAIMGISHTNYIPIGIAGGGDLGDIMLQSK